MTDLSIPVYGETRTRVASDHALIGPDSRVRSRLTEWNQSEVTILISPAMGSYPRSPRFCQYLVHAIDETTTSRAAEGIERLIYVLEGTIEVEGRTLGVDSFAWFPPDRKQEVRGQGNATLLVIEKPYSAHAGTKIPERIVACLEEAPAVPFMGDPNAMLATLLPTDVGFDMAVNVFTYQAGATLPFVETHVMEHGLYMRTGRGVYRLSESWYPVAQGDAIWMAAYCPQWFLAAGPGSASYIYYKDVNRNPMQP